MTISTWLGAVNLAFFLDGCFYIYAAATGFTCAQLICGWHCVVDVFPPLYVKKPINASLNRVQSPLVSSVKEEPKDSHDSYLYAVITMLKVDPMNNINGTGINRLLNSIY